MAGFTLVETMESLHRIKSDAPLLPAPFLPPRREPAHMLARESRAVSKHAFPSEGSVLTSRSSRPSNKGFTLIELMIVVVILGILATIALPQFQTSKENAHMAACKSDCKHAYEAAVCYFMFQCDQ